MKTKFARVTLALAAGASLAGPLGASGQELIPGRAPAPAPAPAVINTAPAKPAAAAMPAPAAAAQPASTLNGLPLSAPSDDYEFMGWCTGILTGHMDLYPRIKPELDDISKRWNSLDEDNRQQTAQQAEGKILLARFRKVMATAEAARPALGPVGQAAIQKGMASWSKIDTVDRRAQAYSWMDFGLPEQCESKVAALETKPYVPATVKVSATGKPSTPGKPASEPKGLLSYITPGPVEKHSVVADEAAKAKAKREAQAKEKAEKDSASSAGLRR